MNPSLLHQLLNLSDKKEVDQIKSWKHVVENGELSNSLYHRLFQLSTEQILNFINKEITTIGAQDIFNKHYQYYHKHDLSFVELNYIWIRSQQSDYKSKMNKIREFCKKIYHQQTLSEKIVDFFQESFPDGEIVVYQSGRLEIITIDKLYNFICGEKYIILDQDQDTPTRYYEDQYCNDQLSKDIEQLTAYQRNMYIDHWRIKSLTQEIGIKTFLNTRMDVLRNIKQTYETMQKNSPSQLLQLEKDCSENQRENLENLDWDRYHSLVEFYNVYLVLTQLQDKINDLDLENLGTTFSHLINNSKHQKVLDDCKKIIDLIKKPK